LDRTPPDLTRLAPGVLGKGSTSGLGWRISSPQGSRTSQGRPFVTTRTRGRSGIFTRRNTILAAAMGLISFALGYFIHPM